MATSLYIRSKTGLKDGYNYMKDSYKSMRGETVPVYWQSKDGLDLYKLPLKESHRDDQAKLRRCVLGKLDKHSEQKTIMMIGATGSGKSTMIDGICNYMFGTTWEDKKRLVMVDPTKEELENQIRGEAMSQTEFISVYTVPEDVVTRVPYTLNIVDTPGFGDVRGVQRDKEIVDQIRVLFENRKACGIDTIHAVCFLVQAPLARLTPTQKYIFDAILSMFGKDIENNILIMTTFADGAKAPVLAALKSANVPYTKAFKFNNSALFASNVNEDLDDDSDDETDTFSKNFWEMGMKSFQSFFKYLQAMDGISLTLTKEVLKQRYILQENLKHLTKKVEFGLATMVKLKEEKVIFQMHEAALKDNKDFKFKVWEDRQVSFLCESTHHVTNCIVCNSPCHDPCTIAKNSKKSGCWAMSNGHCRICEKKCHWTKHQNTGMSYKIVRKEVEKTHFEMKKAYETAKGKKITGKQMIECLEEDYKHTQTEVRTLVARCKHILDRLDEIALQRDPLSEIGYIEILIASEERHAKPGWEKRVQELHEIRLMAERMRAIEEGRDVLKEEALSSKMQCISEKQK